MAALGRYDSSMQMFIDTPKAPDKNRLAFLRWLVEHGRIDDGPVLGPSVGPLAVDDVALARAVAS